MDEDMPNLADSGRADDRDDLAFASEQPQADRSLSLNAAFAALHLQPATNHDRFRLVFAVLAVDYVFERYPEFRVYSSQILHNTPEPQNFCLGLALDV